MNLSNVTRAATANTVSQLLDMEGQRTTTWWSVAPRNVTRVTVATDVSNMADEIEYLWTGSAADRIFGTVMMSLIVCLALFGNGSVLYVIARTPHLRTQISYYFLVNLCAVDTLSAIFCLPVAIVTFVQSTWVWGTKSCEVFGLITNLFTYTSVFTICVISMERYYSVRSPMQHAANMTLGRTACILLSVWVVSMVIALMPASGWNSYTYQPRKYVCTFSPQEPSYVLFSIAVCFILPASVMAVMHCAIYRVAKKAASQIHPVSPPHQPHASSLSNGVRGARPQTTLSSPAVFTGPDVIPPQHQLPTVSHSVSFPSTSVHLQPPSHPCTPTHASSRRPASRWKAVKTLFIIMFLFLALWTPHCVVNIMAAANAISGSLRTPPYPEVLEVVTTWLGFASFAVNPFVYGYMNRSLKEAMENTWDAFRAFLCRDTNVETIGANEDFFQFLERTSTRTLSIPKTGSPRELVVESAIAEEKSSSHD